MRHIILLFTIVLVAGCVQLPPSPRDVQAKKFESVPGKAVIYVVRSRVDSRFSGVIMVDDRMIGTHAGTYLRVETNPGVHRIEGAGASTAVVEITAEAGKIYFVELTVYTSKRDGTNELSLRRVDENRGRMMVSDAEIL